MNKSSTEQQLSDILRMLMTRAGIHYEQGRKLYGF